MRNNSLVDGRAWAEVCTQATERSTAPGASVC